MKGLMANGGCGMRSNEQIKELALGRRRDLPSRLPNEEAKDADVI